MVEEPGNQDAVGECAEHNGSVYGLVAPGMEQASVAAHHIIGENVAYQGSVSATRLKVVDKTVFSVGVVGDDVDISFNKQLVYQDSSQGTYRCLTLRRFELIGVVALGAWSQVSRLQEMVTHRRKLYPWQIRRFIKTGELWNEENASHIASWPARAVVCNCTGVTRGELTRALEQQNHTLESLAKCTGASTVCGSCRPLVAQLVDDAPNEATPAKGITAMAVLALAAFVATLLLLGVPTIEQASSVQYFSLNFLWEDTFWKQVTGFTVLGLSVIGLLMSLRKRWKLISFGDFNYWRVVHTALGVTVLVVLLLHTGLQMGANLNLTLMLTFLAVALTGALAGAIVALEPRLDPLTAKRARSFINYVHLIVFWPLPVLLGFHIVSFYYF